MTRVKINDKILSEMTFQEAYPEVIRLLIEGRFPDYLWQGHSLWWFISSRK